MLGDDRQLAHEVRVGRLGRRAILENLERRRFSLLRDAGVMLDRRVWTTRLGPRHTGPRRVLGDILENEADVPAEYYIPRQQMAEWKRLKGAKHEERVVAWVRCD